MTVITITSVTKDSPGAGQVTIVGTYATSSFTQPAQQTSIGETPAGNSSFSRTHRLTSEAVQILRNGATGVALPITSMATIGYSMEASLTYAPKFTTQPSNMTATGYATLTSNGTNVTNNDTVTIGNKTYTFKTALTPTEGEVLRGADSNASLLNLIRAINHTGTPDTDYKCAAAHTQVTAAAAVTSNAFLITAITTGLAANSYASTETAATLSFGAATFTVKATFTTVINSELAGTTYAWYESADGTTYGAALADAGIYSGSTTAALTITPADTTKNGYYYKCIATNGAGATTSTARILTVTS